MAATALVTVTALFLCHAYEAVLTVREQAEVRLATEQCTRAFPTPSCPAR